MIGNINKISISFESIDIFLNIFIYCSRIKIKLRKLCLKNTFSSATDLTVSLVNNDINL